MAGPGSLLDEVRQVARGWRWTRRPLVPRSAEPWLADPEPREFPTAWARTPGAKAVREGLLNRNVPGMSTRPHESYSACANLDYFSRMFFKVDKLISISFATDFSIVGINMFTGYFNVPALLQYTLV